MRWKLGMLLLFLTAWCIHASGRNTTLLALAADNRLMMMIGQYDGGRWVQSTDFYAPPEPGDRFTLYGPQGAIAEAVIAENRRANPEATFAGWSADFSREDHGRTAQAMAVSGPMPSARDLPPLKPILLDSPLYENLTARYLKGKGLHVEKPLLMQVLSIPVQGDSREETVVVAHSADPQTLKPGEEAAMYAVALLWWKDHGKETLFPLASQTSLKPASQTLDEHRKYYGTLDAVRLVGAVDVDGDGWKEIMLALTKDDAVQADVFHFNGRRLKKVLSAYKPNYN